MEHRRTKDLKKNTSAFVPNKAAPLPAAKFNSRRFHLSSDGFRQARIQPQPLDRYTSGEAKGVTRDGGSANACDGGGERDRERGDGLPAHRVEGPELRPID